MKKAVVAILGCALLLIGIALLVLPGPGFLLIAAALALLATQFNWAKRPLDYAKDKAQVGIEQVGASKWRASLAVASALALIAVGVVEVAGIEIPFVNMVSAILLIGSGLFLLGTIVYALRRTSGNSRTEEPARQR